MKRERRTFSLGSARVSRAGERVLAVANFSKTERHSRVVPDRKKFVAVEHRDQHSRRARYPESVGRAFSFRTRQEDLP